MRLTRRGILGGLLGMACALSAGSAIAVEWLKAPPPVPRPERAAASASPATPSLPALPNAPSGVTGWMAVDLDTGAVIDARNPDHAFAPASVAKLPTAFHALERLGPEHRFETRLMATGPVQSGTLQGDLVLVGGGDPELDTDALVPLVAALAQQGIVRVAGRLVVDGSAALSVPAIDPDQPIDAAYNPALSGLSLNFNRVRLKWATRGTEQTLRVSALALRHDPEVSGVRVALAGASDAPLFSHALEDGTEVWRIRARDLRGKGERWLPVRRPELHAGEVLAKLAAAQGITLGAAVEGRAPAGARLIARVESRPLTQMVASMLRHSTNLTAELVGQAAARAGGRQPGSLAASGAATAAWAAGVAGFPAGDSGFRLANHSGLSQASRLSPRRMVELLAALARRQPGQGVRYKGLPGGVIDLLRDYNVAAKGVDIDFRRLEVAAKTGTMDYMRGLAGYIVTPGGRRLAFAVFSNDLERRRSGVSQIDRGWMARARAFERALVRNWVLALDG
ncbi:MAG TPA: D-alanyl-D-alanine carboxypeptidase/D-alanyl-D-alanine-endopeptidase [Thermohalobaculum sp.]|nr:D-alanyl-D-alanine carboxypeptidase/D-alanyl-D-alanine-endopeptidase [Thermohalobaculum sp.]